ncbi:MULTISPECIES: DedA family protein [Exiguobacterium]|uniref:SNARE associated Golgi protein n=1 Tax=Exiguobacterium sibiricum (strain DSM 17290 / CCUG 55495 / CIP 109462 / JCM 13490 / 255-15) TaxID=262543 RepID=B1YEV0_EXIS2|nr:MULTISPECIES: DedA family protein [Exiguobacterium]ACB60708.1 SNARE associated Golgi protein [Exiguobacterium sibiricum 255-15]MDW2885960.1 DedA family protein [Exiguobacterium sibiricum]RDB34412.1 DedA family protein [Exiguobacterium sp. RIT594]
MLSQVVNNVLLYLADLGYFGIALGLMIEIIPSEIVLSYGGFMISQGTIGWPLAVVAAVIGGLFSQLFLYWFARYGGRPLILKYGKYLLITEHHLDLAERWFLKYGQGVIFGARFIPVVRHAISIPAGLAKMDQTKFSLYTILAIIPWSILFLYLGETLGTNWRSIKEVAAPYTNGVLIAAVVMILVYVFLKKRQRTT